MSPLEITTVVICLGLGAALLTFWIWMLVDCLKHEPRDGHDRLIWALVIILAELLGAIIYYFVRYRPRRVLPS